MSGTRHNFVLQVFNEINLFRFGWSPGAVALGYRRPGKEEGQGLIRERRNWNAWQILFSNHQNVLSIFQEAVLLWIRFCFQGIFVRDLKSHITTNVIPQIKNWTNHFFWKLIEQRFLHEPLTLIWNATSSNVFTLINLLLDWTHKHRTSRPFPPRPRKVYVTQVSYCIFRTWII